ncbi:efflux RND transporter periplasmic adaptor subunit [Desulfosarcina sp. OttesenSCG-928-A07]|nr:efflux RND transporter periplasmic adaptor subunit [Desulfosarcina sp. OttesenSCG-928-G17]MDL2329921.1 efflux RND transporter periplasmic adaptor subunit [Desulfosarcina sp. OttesenSCG-928-A07]
MKPYIKKMVLPALVLLGAGASVYLWMATHSGGDPEGFMKGNGRIEATEINIATKLAGRIDRILVDEGDFVEAGQVLAVMQTRTLEAELAEASAKHLQAITAEAAARMQIALRENDKRAAQATVTQRESELDIARRKQKRSAALAPSGGVSRQELDDDNARVNGAEAALVSANAQVDVAHAALESSRSEAEGARAAIRAAAATVARIQADIDDSTLLAPCGGRIQYRIAQPGEVLGAGGTLLNLVDLSDVYMTFFLPELVAGKVALGSEARIVLDAVPHQAIPATISFVASNAQFTPKTVETESERQKLMFRLKAQISPEFLQKNLTQVKTGLPGVAWVRLDAKVPWPDTLGGVQP